MRRGKLLLGLGAVLLVVSAWLAGDLKFDQSIESLYSANDPHLLNYLESKRLFGGDEFLIVAWRQPELFLEDRLELQPAALSEIERLTEQLNAIPGISSESTQNLALAMRFPGTQRQVLKMLEGALINADRDATAIFLRLTPETDADKRAATFRAVRNVADARATPTYVVGEPLHIHDMFRYVQEDGSLLFRISFGLLTLVLLILFRSIRWILLPAAIVALSIEMTYGLLVLVDVPLSMVSAILNSLVTIIGVATVMHVAVHYRDERAARTPPEALRATLIDLLPPVFWTCATTSAGFLALLASEITPIRSFGLMMALASMLVFVSTVLVLPGGILLLARWQNDPGRAPAENLLLAVLDRVSGFVARFPWSVSCSLAAVFLLAGFGFLRLRVETDFSKNFREASPLVQSLRFVERELGGAGTFEVNFPVPEEITTDVIDDVRQLTAALRELNDDGAPLLTSANSLSDAVDLVPSVPFVMNTPRKKLNLIRGIQPELEWSLYNPEAGRMRIFLRSYEQQSAERKNAVIESVRATARAQHPDAEVSGIFVLLTFLIDSLLSDQVTSFAYASLGLLLLMTVAFRSLKLGLVGMLPNVFPIVLVIGGMGWADVPINIATAMITCVSLGLTVDSSIHYLAAYLRARQSGQGVDEALLHTHRNVGRALAFANLALVAGFSVLTVSHFIPLVYFGMLVSTAMTGGLLGNLLLLPILLRAIDRGSPGVANE